MFKLLKFEKPFAKIFELIKANLVVASIIGVAVAGSGGYLAYNYLSNSEPQQTQQTNTEDATSSPSTESPSPAPTAAPEPTPTPPSPSTQSQTQQPSTQPSNPPAAYDPRWVIIIDGSWVDYYVGSYCGESTYHFEVRIYSSKAGTSNWQLRRSDGAVGPSGTVTFNTPEEAKTITGDWLIPVGGGPVRLYVTSPEEKISEEHGENVRCTPKP